LLRYHWGRKAEKSARKAEKLLVCSQKVQYLFSINSELCATMWADRAMSFVFEIYRQEFCIMNDMEHNVQENPNSSVPPAESVTPVQEPQIPEPPKVPQGNYHYTAPRYGTWQAEPQPQNTWAQQQTTWAQSQPYTQAEPQPQPEPKKKRREKKNRPGLKIAALALCFSLLGAALGAGGVVLADRLTPRQAPANNSGSSTSGETVTSTVQKGERPSTVLETVAVDTDKLMTPAEVYAANVNSTVGITTSITVNYWGYQSTAAASGSGFIISEDGYIITNHHVIEDSDSVTVTLYDGTQYDAEIVGYDASNDLAVLKVDAKGLPAVVIGDSDNLNVGDPVVAIGNPLGELTFSLTSGSVSALNRPVTLSNTVTMELIQTDCAINSGNSGGALFNLYGEVIGITNAKYSSSSYSEASIDNIGFAIPMNNVMKQVKSLIENGYISKPYIGVMVGEVSADAQAYGIPAGAAVDSVSKNSPAEKAGLKKGDIIIAVDGKKVENGTELVDVIGELEVGQTLTLDVYRKGETLQIKVTTEEHIQAGKEETAQPSQQPSQGQQGGQNQQGQQGGQSLPWPWSEFFGGMF